MGLRQMPAEMIEELSILNGQYDLDLANATSDEEKVIITDKYIIDKKVIYDKYGF